MGSVFAVDADKSLFDILAHHIFFEHMKEEISKVKIILPCKEDVIALMSSFKKCDSEKCMILPEMISLENIDEEDLILNIDRIKVISPIKKILVLIQFILFWNKENNDNFSIDLSFKLSSLIDEIQHMIKMSDCYQLSDHSNKTENFINLLFKTWNKSLKDLEVMDMIEHKNNYMYNMINSLNRDQCIIFVGIGKGKIYKLLIKSIYNLPLGKIIIPNINFEIKENDWKFLDKNHYQYCIKDLLDYLNLNREDVTRLNCLDNKTIDYIFDTTADFSKVKDKCIANIEVINCDSREEEAQVISMIIENEGCKNVSLCIFDKLLVTQAALHLMSENYSYITLMLYSVEVLISDWNSIFLLSLLKHGMVTFGYSQKKWAQILSEFEIQILRGFSTNGPTSIINAISDHGELKYKEDMLIIINKLKAIFSPLLKLNSTNCFISDVVTTHLLCINLLSGVNFLELSNEFGNFIRDFMNACDGVSIQCSLELYMQVLTLFFKREFFSVPSGLNKFSLYNNKVVILAGFYDLPSFQRPFLSALTRKRFEIPSVEEEHGCFLYSIRSLFSASKVYIISLLSKRKSILLQRLDIVLLQRLKCPYRDRIRILNVPEKIFPCTRPMPRPNIEVRKAKMQFMSCTAIEKLIRNPYSFYVEYILNLKHLRELNFEPSILEFGTMVHNIIERYLHNKDSQIHVVIQEVFSAHRFNFLNVWLVKLQKVIQSFVEFERNRNNQVELEKNFSYPVSLILRYNNEANHALRKIVLTARCDRIEYLPDGQVAIVDYKVGSFPSNKEVMSGFFPQLILQALAVKHTTKKEVSELSYWKLDYDKVSVHSLKNCKHKIQEFYDYLPSFLSNYLRETTPFIASPYFDKFLRLNSYKQLERVGEWLL